MKRCNQIKCTHKVVSHMSHEWNKHGTCAGILPELAGEYNYFKKTMDILKQFNFDSGLGYEAWGLGTIHQKVKTTYIVQIEICLDKTFQPMQCPGYILSKGNCGKRVLYYPTITHK
ncbi:Ribonuclease 2 [Holothuria leucospilota]|uniref:Ribonuclease 2 n=1 Tax=Holothuria leucospilota TaxID=206669 RepID=A0A9Q1HHU5_HOLLE|nr:Ribonuclease 2 [Holothuria leucospilota]